MYACFQHKMKGKMSDTKNEATVALKNLPYPYGIGTWEGPGTPCIMYSIYNILFENRI